MVAANGGSAPPAHVPAPLQPDAGASNERPQRRTDDDHVAGETWALAAGAHVPPDGTDGETLNARTSFASQACVIGRAHTIPAWPFDAGEPQVKRHVLST